MKKRLSDPSEDTAQLLRATVMISPSNSEGAVGTLDCGGGAGGGPLSVLYLPPEFRAIRLYRSTTWKQLMYALLSVASLGVLPLVAYYVPLLHAACTRTPLSSALFATSVLVQHMDSGLWESVPVHRTGETIWFEFRKHRYVLDDASGFFQRCSATCHALPASTIVQRLASGYSDSAATVVHGFFGPNALDISVAPLHHVLLEKLLHPFYLFQFTSVFLWIYEEYYTYSCLIFAMSVGSLLYEAFSQVSSSKKLHDLVQMDHLTAQVLRNHVIKTVSVESLVVGDVVLVGPGVVPADMALVQGECAADESSLTGEAIPVHKHSVSLVDDDLSLAKMKATQKACLLHSGSSIVRMDAPICKAIVLATGFHTSKGDLFRSIVCPKPIQFQVEKDSYRFLAALSVLALVTGIKNAMDAASHGMSWTRILVSSLDLITIAVPPALPLILSVGVGYSLHRLQRQGIFCIDSPKINLAGHLTCFCFDKTGTLTTDTMVFQGVDVVTTDTASLAFSGLQPLSQSSHAMQHGAGTCHGVTWSQGQLVGSPLEISLFHASKHRWDNATGEIECPTSGKRFTYVKKFAFDASLQRSSIVLSDGQVYVKGSPEAMVECCVAVPAHFHDTVHAYAKDGYYCMGLATKHIVVQQDIPRAHVESQLTFLGLLLFLNPIKPESAPLMEALQTADIDVRIITGDNALTAIHVARGLAMDLRPNIVILDVDHADERNDHVASVVMHNVDSGDTQPYSMDAFLQLSPTTDFALTGASLHWFQTSSSIAVDLIGMVDVVKIFARIRPDQKTWLVETLMAQGHYVGMCGDGTNDCGALKAAHVGLALSDAEASIVAPFTSRQQHILDVLTLIREGRCALTTSYLGFKYMVMYPVTQVVMTSTLYAVLVTLGNYQFLLDDMVIVLGLSILMLHTDPTPVLSSRQPAMTLFARSIVWSMAGHVLIFVVCFSLAMASAAREPWYCSVDQARANATRGCYTYVSPPGDGYTRVSYENSVAWLFGHWEFVIVAVAMNLKDPFRQAVWPHNKLFVGYVVAMIVLLLWLTLTHNAAVLTWLELLPLPVTFQWHLLSIVALNATCSIGWEYVVTRVLDVVPPTSTAAIDRIHRRMPDIMVL
ncbi:Aste57867_8432 [Aphanomyces stellatus]|uniref:Aste57867_8432 protein n=1 Tax=Aphanomyces stellatus TaxID=120398 RepID=A0A485KKD6_9STRA|nr:hypothetical protein As57867_008400 [Aphanomyces stellatus]VFT85318.1 Aste57867_8432 [Aphanomyces stellatus]